MALSKGDKRFKFILFGRQRPGKSSIRSQFISGEFANHNHVSPVFWLKKVDIDGLVCSVELWDTLRHDPPTGIPLYWRQLAAVLLVFDVTNRSTVEPLEIYINVAKECDSKPVIVIIGNKADEHNREVTTEEGKEFATLNDALYIETSAKTGLNINKLFEMTLRACLEKERASENNKANRGFPLTNVEPTESSCPC